jgi:hypothetical protein
MTLADKIALHRDKVRNWTVTNLRTDKGFMDDCQGDAEFVAWVRSQRHDKPRRQVEYKVKFKKQEKFIPVVVKEPDPVNQVKPEPVRRSPTIAELIKDIKALHKKKE